MDGHRVFETQDGTRSLFSERFGVSYHSKYGAWQETQHVFIEAGLRYRAAVPHPTPLAVLDIGYGTGLNAIATLLFAVKRALDIDYTALEAYPVPTATLRTLDYPGALEFTAEDSALYSRLQGIPWPGTAQLGAAGPRLTPKLTVSKRLCRFEELADEAAFDVVYYDAFAPEAQPELWTPEQFARVYRALRPGGLLVTYCAKGQVKRDLRSVGFAVERLKGPPGKREMTRATRTD